MEIEDFRKTIKHLWHRNWDKKPSLGYVTKKLRTFWDAFSDKSSSSHVRLLSNSEAGYKIVARKKLDYGRVLMGGFINTKGCDSQRLLEVETMSETQKKKTGLFVCQDGPMHFIGHSSKPNCQWYWNKKKCSWDVYVSSNSVEEGKELTIFKPDYANEVSK